MTKKANPDNTTPVDGAQAQPVDAPQLADLPMHGGVYEFNPATQTMRSLEGGPPAEAGANTSATTGEQP